jgi:hypothetical protein
MQIKNVEHLKTVNDHEYFSIDFGNQGKMLLWFIDGGTALASWTDVQLQDYASTDNLNKFGTGEFDVPLYPSNITEACQFFWDKLNLNEKTKRENYFVRLFRRVVF